MKEREQDIISILEANNCTAKVESWGVFSSINGIKLEWNWKFDSIIVGHSSTEADREAISNLIEENILEAIPAHKKTYLKYVDVSVELFESILEVLLDADLELEKAFNVREPSVSGVTFEGTIFSNLKERGATMSGKFGKMVCEASNMNLEEMLAEFHTQDHGQIDGVELCPETQKPISVYECQSGIHKGAFLDDNHLSKALGRYIYAPEILPTVKKVVILAGGYSASALNIVTERASELAKRDQPIKVVLLKTTKTENKIGIDVVFAS